MFLDCRYRDFSRRPVFVPNSVIAKMRIQNHGGGSRRYNGSVTVAVDSRNEPELVLETLKQAAMTCASILEQPVPSVGVVTFNADRITYEISFSTGSIAAAGDARSQLITQLYKRARPRLGRQGSAGLPIAQPDLLSRIKNFFHLSVPDVPLNSKTKP
jgi:small-conductance mechanosensitive channel